MEIALFKGLYRAVCHYGAMTSVEGLRARNEWNTHVLGELQAAHRALLEYEASTRALRALQERHAEATQALTELQHACGALLKAPGAR